MLYFFLLFFFLKNHDAVLNLSVVPQKQTFEQGEPVDLKITLQNQGNIPFLVDNRFLPGPDSSFGQEITLLVTGPGERPIPFGLLFQPSVLEESSLETVSPHQAISQNLTLSNIFTFPDSGIYTVQVIYDTTKIPGVLPFWRGRLVSAPVTFTVSGEKK